ncbi:putative O-methyltransferase YrrM [Mycolicibacterium sp. BK556]|nr:hypothetical protein [Mycolicibacterium sp. BK607]MBB3602762.1 putative O-methyltransferase YrrM [Mycolicibacterium sp. BK556]MBB3632957.1 putative O-methyltransferase YrrM [Mycolicibacterium sp. BK607]
MALESVEEAIGAVLSSLRANGFEFLEGEINWREYQTTSYAIHHGFDVPATSITPQMRRALFAIGNLWPDPSILGLGTHAGYAVAWLWAGARARHGHARLCGYDTDRGAVSLATKNFRQVFGVENSTRFVLHDACVPSVIEPVGVVYLDIESPEGRKWGYMKALDAQLTSLTRPGLLVAHDPLVPKFAEEMASFKRHAVTSGFCEPVILPIDSCGVLLAHFPEPTQ